MIELPGMMTYHSFEEIPSQSHVVSIGTFDGIHVGHQELLRSAHRRADELGVAFLVVTFEPPPSKVIRPESYPGRLVTAAHKLELLNALDVPSALILEFNNDLMKMRPEVFVGMLDAAAHPAEIWVGEDFALGHNRSGDVKRLTSIGATRGIKVIALPQVVLGGEAVSSSRIRKHVMAGEAKAAKRMLGHPFRIQGEVIEGARIGRKIGYPTANVEPPSDLVALPDGIYVSRAGLPGEPVNRPAMTYIGMRPALNTGNRLIETHLLDFSGDLYGMSLATDVLERLRPDATFAGVEALVRQLQEDERNARRVLAELAEVGYEAIM